MYISDIIEKTGLFDIYNDGSHLPIVCYKLKDDAAYEDGGKVEWNLYDLADRLMMHGWQVPAYPLPANMESVIIQRMVCRVDLGYNLAEELMKDFRTCSIRIQLQQYRCFQELDRELFRS